MENKTGNVMSGVGGAALLALFLSPASMTNNTPAPATIAKGASTMTSPSAGLGSRNTSGPWSAICEEYKTEFDPLKGHVEGHTGAMAHTIPFGANLDALEYTRHTKDKEGVSIDEKFQVKSHPVGNVSDCIAKDQGNIEVLIATVPDPLASHFALYFDRDIEALERASALSSYSISRYWLPWDQTDNPTGGLDASKLAESKAKLEEPGVLTFHSGNGNRLLVFLVGETPTSGIQRSQFMHALRYAQDLLANNSPGSRTPTTLRIVGPHFSGSLLGMAEILGKKDLVPPCTTSLRILSPNANAESLIESFRAQLSLAEGEPKQRFIRLCPTPEPPGPDRVLQSDYPDNWFVTLKLKSRDQREAAINYLTAQLGYSPRDVALLDEDESAYSVTTSRIRGDPRDFLSLKYPRDLSSLRNKTDSTTPSEPEINGIKIPLWNVPVMLGERSNVEQDSPRAFAINQEASRIDHALQAIVASLQQHKIRALIIYASNNLDTLFLLEHFKRALPNLRFAALDADEFEVGRPQNIELTGTISVTDLPLLRDPVWPSMDEYGKEKEEHASFGSSDTEGTYIAVNYLLENTPMGGSKYRGGECATTSLVGRSGFLLTAPRTNRLDFPCITTVPTALHLHSGKMKGVSRSWIMVLLATLIAVAIHLVSIYRGGIFVKLKVHPARISYPADCGIQESKRVAMLLTLNFQYIILEFVVCATSWTSRMIFNTEKYAWLLQTLNLILLGTCLIVSVLLIWNGFTRPNRKSFWFPFLLTTSYTAATLWTWGWLLWHFPSGGQVGETFDALRVILVSEGLSPFTPLLLITIAYIVYASIELNGIGWAARRHVRLPPTRNSEPELDLLHKRLQDELKPFSRRAYLPFVSAITGMIIFSSAFQLDSSLAGFDGLVFKWWLVCLGFGGCLVLIVFAVLRAWSTWGTLKSLLLWLQNTSLKPAFTTLHEKDLPKLRIWDLGKQEQDLTIHARTLESLTELLGEVKTQRARQAFIVIRKAQTNGEQHSTKVARELSDGLNLAMYSSLSFLNRTPAVSDRVGVEKQRYLSLRVVALIRYALLHIRNLYTFVVYGFACLAACVTMYPFEGRSNLSALLTTVFFLILGSVGLMFAQIQKDNILSLIENSGPGEVKYTELFKHLFSIGGVPALIVVATQFPSIAQVVLSWAKPGLDLMK